MTEDEKNMLANILAEYEEEEAQLRAQQRARSNAVENPNHLSVIANSEHLAQMPVTPNSAATTATPSSPAPSPSSSTPNNTPVANSAPSVTPVWQGNHYNLSPTRVIVNDLTASPFNAAQSITSASPIANDKVAQLKKMLLSPRFIHMLTQQASTFGGSQLLLSQDKSVKVPQGFKFILEALLSSANTTNQCLLTIQNISKTKIAERSIFGLFKPLSRSTISNDLYAALSDVSNLDKTLTTINNILVGYEAEQARQAKLTELESRNIFRKLV